MNLSSFCLGKGRIGINLMAKVVTMREEENLSIDQIQADLKTFYHITLQDVKNQANLFLESYHSSLTLPVPIEDIAELKLGLKVILISGLIKNFGVNAFINQNFDSIVIDEGMYTKQPERIRFTIAEEIGHLFLFRNQILLV